MKRYNTSLKCLLALFVLSTLAPTTMHGMNNNKNSFLDKHGTEIAIGVGLAIGSVVPYFVIRDHNMSKELQKAAQNNAKQKNMPKVEELNIKK